MKVNYFAIGTALALFTGSYLSAEVPTLPPVFNDPLNVTNAYAPFQPAGMKIFQGNNGRKKAVLVHLYLTETRAFDWNGTNVTTSILREMDFQDGQLAELTDHYLAQGNDGALYTFGKIVNLYTNGTVVNHAGTWLVGEPSSFDPAGTLMVLNPALITLSNPELGDTFQLQDPTSQSAINARVTRTNITVATGLGRFTNAVRIVERTARKSPTTLTYARDVGLATKRTQRESLRLIASTLTGNDLIIPTNNVIAPTNAQTDTNINFPRPVPIRPIVTPTFPETPVVPENPTTPGTNQNSGTPINPGTNSNPGTNLPPLPPLPN